MNIARIPHGLFIFYTVLATLGWFDWVWAGGRPFFGGYYQQQIEMGPISRWSSAFLGMNGFIATVFTLIPMIVTDIKKFFTGDGEPDGIAPFDNMLNQVGISRSWEREFRGPHIHGPYFYKLASQKWKLRKGKWFWRSEFPTEIQLEGFATKVSYAIITSLLFFSAINLTTSLRACVSTRCIKSTLITLDELIFVVLPRIPSLYSRTS